MASTEDDVVVRLRLKDVRQFIEDVKAGKLAIDDLEKKVKKAGQTAARESSSSGGFGKLASHFGFLKYAAVGVAGSMAAAAGGVVGYAVKSASSLEQVTVAFTTLLHSSSAAKTMVASLQTFAQQTPFELSGVEQTTQRLLAFGFSAKSVIPTLTAIGNAASGLNLGQQGMDEIALVLGQMKSLGRIQGGDLLQLAQHGVNGYGILEKGLGLTPAAFQKAMQAGKVSAAKGVPILLAGMEAQYKGLMAKESGTLGGIWSNLHDAIQQGLIKLVNPFMPAMKRWLGEVTNYLGDSKNHQGMLSRAAKFMAFLPGNITAGRANYAAYNIGAIIGNHGFDPAIEKGVRVLHNLGVIVKDILVPAVAALAPLLAPVVMVLDHLDAITGFIADHATVFGALTTGVLTAVAAFKAYQLVMIGVNAITAAFDILAAANPFGLIALAIAGVAAGLIYAYKHSETFRRFVDGLWAGIKGVLGWVKDHWRLLSVLLLEPFGLVVVWIADHWGVVSAALTGIWSWVHDHWGTIGPLLTAPFEIASKAISMIADSIVVTWNNTVGRLGGPQIPTSDATAAGAGGGSWFGAAMNLLNPVGALTGAAVDRLGIGKPHQANGGTTVSSGMSWVGERGPELLSLPRGAQVIPLPRVPEFAGGGRGPVHVHVMLDKREIAQAVYDDMGDRVARR